MNQILNLPSLNKKDNKNIKKSLKNKSNLYKYIFLFLLFFIILLIIYVITYIYKLNTREKYSNSLENKVKISNLYNRNFNYFAQKISNDLKSSDPFLIGIIEIDKINLHYPLLSNATAESLKISPCRFARSYAK